MGCLPAKSCKSMVKMLAKSCKSMVEMLEKVAEAWLMLATNLTISPPHHLTSHHLCNLRKIVYNGICTGFDEALA